MHMNPAKKNGFSPTGYRVYRYPSALPIDRPDSCSTHEQLAHSGNREETT